MPYTHLTQRERVCIFHQHGFDFSKAEIARRLKRHRATIGRELRRFHRHPSWPCYRQYFPDAAEQLAQQRRARPRGFRWTGTRDQREQERFDPAVSTKADRPVAGELPARCQDRREVE